MRRITAGKKGALWLVHIDGYISKKAISRWLKDYHEIGKKGTDYSQVPGGAPSATDGWTNGKINKIMLDQALEKIPDPVTKYCAYARWIHLIPREKAIKTLKKARVTMTDYRYKKHCDEAIDFVYREINGDRVGVKALIQEILK